MTSAPTGDGNIITTMATPPEPKRADTALPSLVATSAVPFARVAEILVLGVLLIVAFWPILTSMYGSWFDEHAYMEHGILVVPAAAYMVWVKKDVLRKIPQQRSAAGLLLLLWGALQAMVGIAAQWVWVGRMSFLISLVGWIASLFGWRMVRALVYPLCTLILMIAPPTFVFERLTLSLQLLASRL